MHDPAARLNAALESQYRIERELGEGGMATVYLADDLKHERKVAIKVLKPELAAVIGGERFVAEIKTTAGLQHPHILPLFDSGEADGFLYYVMPYVEGETLRERLEREKQLGVDDALELTRDVADALDYAHRNGILHRDIKPENILLHDGRPVVADFGIAVAISAAGGGRMTETGLSLGTPHYMSPEQATADRDLSVRSDVYSLACVLYEMLAGDPPHTGPTAQSILVRILTETPRPVSDTRTSVPRHVASVLSKALEKLPADRFGSASEFREALSRTDFVHTSVRRTQPGNRAAAGVAGGGMAGSAKAGADERRRRSGVHLLPWAITGVAVASLAIASFGGGETSATGGQTYRLDLDLSGVTATSFSGVHRTAISPDGSMIAVEGERDGRSGIFVRAADEPDFRFVPGTEEGESPDFSPDGEWIVYVQADGSERALRKITVTGGGATTLLSVDSIRPYYPHWATDDQIVFTGPSGVFVASATSGSLDDLVRVTDVTPPDPFLLPDGSGVLTGTSGAEGTGIRFHDLEGDSVFELLPDGHSPAYLETGHILYVSSDGGLFAVPFDLDSRGVEGTPIRVLDRVGGGAGDRAFQLSTSGALIQVEGPVAGAFDGGAPDRRFLLVDLEGNTERVPLPPAPRSAPRFSPDGRFLTYVQGDRGERQLFTYDLLTGDEEQLTTQGANGDPLWSPDGTAILFSSSREGTEGSDLFVIPADGSRPEEHLGALEDGQFPTDWLSDGQIVIEQRGDRGTDIEVATLSLDGDAWTLGEAAPYLPAPWTDYEAAVSPDGALVAHRGYETESGEIWLRSFPDPISRWRVTQRNVPCCGGAPRWAPDGSAVYFTGSGMGVGTPDTLYVARVERDPVRPLAPEPVFSLPQFGTYDWDLHPDGDRFLVLVDEDPADQARRGADEEDGDERIRYFVVINWLAEFERKLAGG